MGCFRIYGYRKSEMLKKFQHDSDTARFPFLITDYGPIIFYFLFAQIVLK